MKETGYPIAGLATLVAAAGLFHHFHIAPRHRVIRSPEDSEEIQVPVFDTEYSSLEGSLADLGTDDGLGGDYAPEAFDVSAALGITSDAEVEEFTVDGEDQESKTLRLTQEMGEYPPERPEMDALRRGGRRKKKKKGAATLQKFKLRDVPGLHSKMLQTYNYRQTELLDRFILSAGIPVASKKPVEELTDEEKIAAHIVDDQYPDYSGTDKTHPAVQKFLDEFDFQSNGKNLFVEGQSQIWFLIPAAVPMYSAQAGAHLTDYTKYWNHVSRWNPAFAASQGQLRVSLGLYHKGAVYSPRGAVYKPKKFPWKRISNYYLRPRTTTGMPHIIPTAESLISWIPRFGGSTPSAGQDCFTVWFHQDFAADAIDLLVPEKFAKLDQIYSMCTVAHVFVGVEKYNERTQAYAASLMPSLQSQISKDPEFSGVFYADSPEHLESVEFVEAIMKYFTVVKARSACRLAEAGWTPPPPPTDGPTALPVAAMTQGTGLPPTEGTLPTLDEVTLPDSLLDLQTNPDLNPFVNPTGGLIPTDLAGTELPPGATTQVPTMVPTMRGLLDDVRVPKVPEIDSCCGHDTYVGIPYDSELRTCCDDGNPQAFKTDGSDPCMSDIGFEFDFESK